jgi:poly(hydroxyalkanoate) granule-associated protein
MTRNVYFAGLGVAATVNDSTKSVFDKLVAKGTKTSDKKPELAVSEAPAVNRLKRYSQKTTQMVRKQVSGVIHGFGIPSRDEIQALTRSVEQLSTKVEKLSTKASA